MIEDYITILPGTSYAVPEEIDGSKALNCIDAIMCDGVITKLSAKASYTKAGLADISAISTGIYAASDAACVTCGSSIVYGQFSAVYNHSTSDNIRVHITKVY
jgi:hypothetical protein